MATTDPDRHAHDGQHAQQPTALSFGTTVPAGARVPPGRSFLGGLATGLAGGLGLYAVLAVVALVQGRDLAYPFHAVHALMSGARVLPDYPRGSLGGPQALDIVLGPLYFFLPALLVGAVTAWWLRRSARGGPTRRSPQVQAAVVAGLLTALFYVLFVLVLGLREAAPSEQRISSGYGIRELGALAWAGGHLVYVVLVVALLEPLTRRVAALGGGGDSEALRGEQG